ncbi:N-acetylglucosamine-6-phosphate deacetylase, partial [Escherichia coli]|nr:N-acetylglucosamine-6-phosphate deacetylase [Escherichia coli]
MLTVAPERVPVATIKRLVDAGVLVSAGHSEASYEQAMAAFDVGLIGITHLYNAMPAMQQRVPGLAGATLD